MESKRLDFVIFGATGFTGKFTVKEATRLAKDFDFTWGIAGRRREALENVIKEFNLESGILFYNLQLQTLDFNK